MTVAAFPNVRSLTDSEATVVRCLLGTQTEPSEEERIRRSGLARSTYLDAKLRVYSWGLVQDMYVPSPEVINVPRISFFLARSFTDQREALAHTLLAFPGTVLHWASPQFQLVVIFHRSLEEERQFSDSLEQLSRMGRVLSCLQVGSGAGSAPIYFDYEGIWNNFCGFSGLRSYPRGLPSAPKSLLGLPAKRTAPLQPLGELLRRPSDGSVDGRPQHLLGPASLPRSQRHLLESGAVEWRVFLPLQTPAAYRSASLADIVFLVGQRREGANLEHLARDLASESRAYPFLLVKDDRNVLLGFVGSGTGPSSGNFVSRSLPVSEVIHRYLTATEVLRDSILHVQTLRSHRYDLLIPPT